VIATGKQISVREFVRMSAKEAGIELEFSGSGVDEIATICSITDPSKAPALKAGDVIVRVDPRYFRPAEVDLLRGCSEKARRELGWTPRVNFERLVAMMVDEDLRIAETERDHPHRAST
jgi:GDPmannose 4,6-dehydratase